MNAGLPIWARVLAVVALVVIVGAGWWLLKSTIYDWLPRDLALGLSGIIVGLIFGFDFGRKSMRKEIEKRGYGSTDYRR